MPLSLAPAHAAAVDGVELELRLGAEAIGTGLLPELARLSPALAPAGDDGAEPEAVLERLDLDHEGAPDGLSLAACVAAHRAYVSRRGRPGALSTGALALARLLVWAHRAALLGSPPSMAWIGPAPRLPEAAAGQVVLRARAAVAAGGATRRAEAAALIAAPRGEAGGAGPG